MKRLNQLRRISNTLKCKIKIEDEVFCTISGLASSTSEMLWNKFGYFVDGYKFMPAFKLGRWSGKIHFYDKNNSTYLNLLYDIVPILEAEGYEIDLEDKRQWFDSPGPVDKNIFEEYGIFLRDHQVKGVNDLLEARGGFAIFCTGAGKSLMTAAISKVFNDLGYKVITIVPSTDLVNQTFGWYERCGIDTGQYCGSVKDIDHLSVVSTWQSLQNNKKVLGFFQVVIFDECFAGHQKVLTASGKRKPISKIKVGEKIISFNSKTEEFEIDIVEKVHTNLSKSTNDNMIRLFLDNGKKIDVTENHLFYTKDHGKVKAKDLESYHDIIDWKLTPLEKQKLFINCEFRNYNQEIRLETLEKKPNKDLVYIFNNGFRIVIDTKHNLFLSQMKSSITFKENADQLLHINEDIRKEAYKKRKHEAAIKGGIATMLNPLNYVSVRNAGKPPWNKGLPGVEPWNKGQTKETDFRLLKMSENRTGEGNPHFGISPSSETRLKQSILMKQNILDGKFTPNVKNNRTQKNIEYNGIKFRSSWEVVFFIATNLEYEKFRFKYVLPDGTTKIYITDFHDKISKIIYEVKPQARLETDKLKLDAANEWCKMNDYEFVIITEFELVELISFDELLNFQIDEITLKKIRGLYEGVEKRKNSTT